MAKRPVNDNSINSEPGDSGTRTQRRSRSYQAQGIVLRRLNLGEADRIVTIFTREFGKRRFVSKGSRKPGSRSAGHLEPYSRTAFLAAETRGLHIITQAESYETYSMLRSSEVSIAYASLMAEQVDSLSEEDERNVKIFDLLNSAYQLLEDGVDQLRTLLVFELHLLQTQGYRPELYSCINCGNRLATGANGFSVDGGVVCHRCLPANYSAKGLSDNAIKLARLIDEGDLGRALTLRTSAATLYELDSALAVYISHISGKSSKARVVLDNLQIRTGTAH